MNHYVKILLYTITIIAALWFLDSSAKSSATTNYGYTSAAATYNYHTNLPEYGSFKIAESYIGDTVCYTVIRYDGPQGISCFKHDLHPDDKIQRKFKPFKQ